MHGPTFIPLTFVIQYMYILKLRFKKFQGISHIFQIWAELLCSNCANIQNALKIKDETNASIVLQISLQGKVG